MFKLSNELKEARRIVTKLSNLTGADLEKPNIFHPSIIIACLVLYPIYFSMQFNGIYQVWPNFIQILQALYFVPIVMQIIARTINRFVYKDEALIINLHEKLLKFYDKIDRKSKIYDKLLKRMETCKCLVKTAMLFFFANNFFGTLTPVLNAIISGKLKMPVPIYLPYTNSEELLGFIINISIYFVLVIYCSLILGNLEFMFVLYCYQSVLIIDIICHKIQELAHFMQQMDMKKQSKWKKAQKFLDIPSTSKAIFHEPETLDNENEIHKKLIEIIKESEFYDDYIHSIFDIMELPTFVVISTDAYALCIATFTLLTSSKIIGLGLFMLLVFQLVSPCMLASLINKQNNRFLREIGNLSWYKLSQKNQKIYLHFLHKLQNGIRLELIMLGTVDMKLFLTIVRGAYSFFMYLWTFTEI